MQRSTRALGIGTTAYGVLARGLLSGHWTDKPAGVRDGRANYPRFFAENLAHNLALVDALRAIASEKNATVAQLAIAWVASRGDDIVPLIGSRRRAVPASAVAGDRYPAPLMKHLDSERGASAAG